MIQNGRHITYFAAENPPPKSPKTPKSTLFDDFGGFGGRPAVENEHIEEVDSSDTSSTVAFPTDAFPGPVADYIREITRVALVPESLAGATVLGILSGSLGAGVEIPTYLAPLRGNLFLLPIASSGTGKDLVMSLAAFPLVELDRDRHDTWKLEVRPRLLSDIQRLEKQRKDFDRKHSKTSFLDPDQKEELYQLEHEKAELEAELKKEPELTCGNVTREMLSMSLANQPGEALISLSSEARGILDIVDGRYGQGDSDVDLYCAGFSGSTSKVNRKGHDLYHLKRPCLSVLWMIQPDCFHSMLEEEEKIDSGFLPRFLFFDTRAQPALIPEQMPIFSEEMREDWRDQITTLIEHYHDREEAPIMLQVGHEASELLRYYDNENRRHRSEGGVLYDVKPFVSRWPEMAWKITLILHIAEHGRYADQKPVRRKTAENAIRLTHWFAGEALHLLQAKRAALKADREQRLIEILKTAPDHTLTLRHLRKNHSFSADEVKDIASCSVKIEVLDQPTEGPGRRSTIARLTKHT